MPERISTEPDAQSDLWVKVLAVALVASAAGLVLFLVYVGWRVLTG